MRNIIICIFGLVFSFLYANPVQAQGVAQPFDWVGAWGSITPTVTGIALDRNNIKRDAYNAVQNCGLGNNDVSSIHVYHLDINGDGGEDYILDGGAYFAKGQSQNCSVKICTKSEGCILDFYGAEIITQIKASYEGEKDKKGHIPSCPATAAGNETCRRDCDATVAKCPHLFKFEMPFFWEKRVFSWSFLTPDGYLAETKNIKNVYGSPKYAAKTFNNNPVFKAQMSYSECSLEEIDENNNGAIDGSESCVKYLQYANARMRDLYFPQAYVGQAENDTRMTLSLYDRAAAKIDEAGKIENLWRDLGEGLEPGKEMAFQIKDFHEGDAQNESDKPATPLICRQVSNAAKKSDGTAGDKIFVPTRTDEEIMAFRKAIEIKALEKQARGETPDITEKQCGVRFTNWTGITSCSQVSLACGETRTIAAERRCQRASSAYGDCGECSDIADPQPLSGIGKECFYTAVCSGGDCGGGAGGDGGGSDCLSADSEVLMEDGSWTRAKEVKLGDKVMAFNKEAPLGALKPAKVSVLAVEENRTLTELNGKSVTLNHPMVVSNGKVKAAGYLREGSKLVGISGEPISVDKIVKGTEKVTVYNFGLEGADGFVADGARVLGIPSSLIHEK